MILTVRRHKFVGSLGHTSEDETGLIHMRARWMDPALGRFISEDPARDGANWFEYCRGNPVNAVDPNGRETLASTVSANGAWASIQGIGGMSAARFMIWLSRIYGVNLRSVQWAQRGQYVTAGSKLCTLLERLEQDPRAWRMLVAEVEGPGSGFLKAWVQYTGRQIVAYLLASPDELEFLTHAVPHISK